MAFDSYCSHKDGESPEVMDMSGEEDEDDRYDKCTFQSNICVSLSCMCPQKILVATCRLKREN